MTMQEADEKRESPKAPKRVPKSRNQLRITIIALILVWTFFYNFLIKGEGVARSFFKILDTISDDFVMGTTVTVGVGVGIVVVFSLTKLYTQVIVNIHSFRMIEELVHEDFRRGRLRIFWSKILHFDQLPDPAYVCPEKVSSLVFSFSFIYVMSWIYVILFSEALFFVSWSAGVDLPINDHTLLMLPTLALAIPFSARVMAYLRYPYAQDYADFMPGAVFVLLLVAALGGLHGSEDQKFFLPQVWNDSQYLMSFLRNGVFLAFIPVFFEGTFWLLELSRSEDRKE